MATIEGWPPICGDCGAEILDGLVNRSIDGGNVPAVRCSPCLAASIEGVGRGLGNRRPDPSPPIRVHWNYRNPNSGEMVEFDVIVAVEEQWRAMPESRSDRWGARTFRGGLVVATSALF